MNKELKELKSLLDYDGETGLFRWKKKATRETKIGSIADRKNTHGYSRIRIRDKEYYSHRLAWFFVYGYIPENGLDHIDRVRANNRIENLREVSQVCNLRNVGNPTTNKSGVKGICFDKSKNLWAAQISVEDRSRLVGRSKDFLEAVCHRLAAEQFLNWDGCDSCSPAYKYVREHIGIK